MRTDRVERLFRLFLALQSDQPRTADELADLLKVSRRTVFRDLALLSRAGLGCDYDRATRQYVIDRPRKLPPVMFTHSEALGLMLATRKLMGHYAPDQASAATAAAKVESVLPLPLRDYCGSVLEHVEVRNEPSSDSQSITGIFSILHHALAGHYKVEFRYDSYNEKETIECVAHPYRLVHMRRGWYLVAYSELHEEIRTFKVERLIHIRRLGTPFTPDEAFSLDAYFGYAWNMIPGDRRHRVRIRFRRMVAANVDEITWHKTQQGHFEDDGSLVFEVEVDGLKEISWWILGYGDQAEVLEPPELRKIVAKHVATLVRIYRNELNALALTVVE